MSAATLRGTETVLLLFLDRVIAEGEIRHAKTVLRTRAGTAGAFGEREACVTTFSGKNVCGDLPTVTRAKLFRSPHTYTSLLELWKGR